MKRPADTPALPVLAKPQGFMPPAKPVDAARLMEDFLQGQTERTRRAYRRDLEDFAVFAGLPGVEGIGDWMRLLSHGQANATVLEYRTRLVEQGLAPATVNRHLSAIRSLSRLARLIGFTTWSIEVRSVKSRKYRDTSGPGRAIYIKMLDLMKDRDWTTVRNRAMIRLLYDSGLRRSEVVKADIEDLDTPKECLWIWGKGRSERERVPVAPPTMIAIQRWIRMRGEEEGPLFLNHHGGRLTDQSLYDFVKALGDRLGVRVRPHGLRHTSISEVVKAKGLVAGQKFGRHGDPKTTMAYLDNLQDVAGDAAREIAPEEDE